MIDTRTATTPQQLTIVRTYSDLRLRLLERQWWVSIPLTTFPAHWLYQGEQRLDASYYANKAFAALRVVRECGVETRSLQKCVSDIFMPALTIKIPFSDRAEGMSYLTQSEAFMFRPEARKRVFVDRLDEPERWLVKPKWLLVSQSGTVGRMMLTTKQLTSYIISPNPIRVVPSRAIPVGYLYAWLACWIGQALIRRSEYGGSVTHILPHHIAGLPVPLLPEAEQQAIHDEVMRAYALRDEANDLLDEADEMLHRELGLPRFDKSLVPYLLPPPREETGKPAVPHPRAFTVRASELNGRLDASYHVPVARTAIALLHKSKYPPVRLGQLADDVFIPPRFKRIYVPKEYGVPFLRPSHLPQMRPYDLGYISRRTGVLDALLLKKGDVLITTDGTVGRIAMVTDHIAGWAGSNNIARITYGALDGRNGYLAAFLSSPYGFHQLRREIYGGVVDHIGVPHIEGVWIPDAAPDVQRAIGARLVSAFERKDEATAIEEVAIRRLEATLEKRATLRS